MGVLKRLLLDNSIKGARCRLQYNTLHGLEFRSYRKQAR